MTDEEEIAFDPELRQEYHSDGAYANENGSNYEDVSPHEGSKTEVIDNAQNQVFEDKSYKHIAKAVKQEQISLDLDFYSSVAFRRYFKREFSPNETFVNVYRTYTDNQIINRTELIIDHSTDIEWLEGTNARFLVSGEFVDDPCTIDVEWNWKQGPNSKSWRQAVVEYRAEEFMPAYADLSGDEQQLATAILGRFSLLRDNHYGQGMPNLAEDVQTSFSLNDVAQEMQIALGRINMNAIQPTNFIIGEGKGQHFPKVFYNYLMVQTLVQLVRKITWGYLETPDINGNPGVAYADRRSYYQKWQSEYKALEEDAKVLAAVYSKSTVSFTASSVLVGGGLYGSGYGMMSNRMTNAIERGWLQNAMIPLNVVSNNANR